MLPRLTHLTIATLLLPSLAGAADSIVDESSPLETIETDFDLADGPAWDGSGLFIPDVKAQKLYRFNPKTGKRQLVRDNIGRISASFFSHGRLHLSDNGERRIARWENGRKVTLAASKDARPPRAPNDLAVDSMGNVYYTLTRQNQVMFVTHVGTPPKVAVDGIETPNGLTLSPDGQTLYVAAYVPKQIWAYDIGDPGALYDGRLFARMDSGPDKGADGMTVDRAGNVYCAGPAHVWVWNPAGELIAKIATPTRPINCAFGDQDLRSLYITGFGGLYRQRMKVYGRAPEPPYTEETQPKNTKRPSTVVPGSVVSWADVPYAKYGNRKLLMDLVLPAVSRKPNPAIVIVHGGGWLNGDKTKFRALAIELATRGYVTAAIEYRLGHEARFPAGIHDCNAAVRFLRANAERYTIDPDRVGAVGGSAGGHLVGLMATGWNVDGLQGDGGNPDQSSRLQAAIVMAGPMQMTTGSVAKRSREEPEKSNSNKWLGKTIDEAPDLYALADAHLHISSASSPILFMTGEHDNPQRNQPSRDKLKATGVWTDLKIYPDGKHGCWNQLPWFKSMVDDMDAFFKEHLK